MSLYWVIYDSTLGSSPLVQELHLRLYKLSMDLDIFSGQVASILSGT